MGQPRLTHRKDLARLIRQAENQGWTVRATSKGHLMFQSPSGEAATTSSTASDHRSMKNHISRMKRLGFRPEGRG
jgi:hypothetical protein